MVSYSRLWVLCTETQLYYKPELSSFKQASLLGGCLAFPVLNSKQLLFRAFKDGQAKEGPRKGQGRENARAFIHSLRHMRQNRREQDAGRTDEDGGRTARRRRDVARDVTRPLSLAHSLQSLLPSFAPSLAPFFTGRPAGHATRRRRADDRKRPVARLRRRKHLRCIQWQAVSGWETSLPIPCWRQLCQKSTLISKLDVSRRE